MTKSTCQIRWMIRRDLPVVLGIERHTYPSAWSEEEFLSYLGQRNCIGMVAERDDRIVGFMVYELHPDHLRLLNFAVSWEERRQRIGEQMARRLIDKLSPRKRREIVLDVHETNLAAQLFFKSLGFEAVAVLRDHFSDTEGDAYRMRYTIAGQDQVTPVNRMTGFAPLESETGQ